MTATITWIDAERQRPDADRTVLIHCPISDDPIWIGYWDGSTWRDVDGGELGPKFVDHWAEFPEPPTVRRSRASKCDPIRALETVEYVLRSQQSYHIAMDRAGKLGLGKWLLRVIRRCKKEAGR